MCFKISSLSSEGRREICSRISLSFSFSGSFTLGETNTSKSLSMILSFILATLVFKLACIFNSYNAFESVSNKYGQLCAGQVMNQKTRLYISNYDNAAYMFLCLSKIYEVDTERE